MKRKIQVAYSIVIANWFCIILYAIQYFFHPLETQSGFGITFKTSRSSNQ